MNILIVTQYFWPEEFRINELGVLLAERGHRITVLTGIPNYPGGKLFPGYGLTRKRSEQYNGLKVIRVPLIPRGKGGRLRLILNYISFAFTASILGPMKCHDAYDVIFVYEPSPITVGLPAIVMKMIKSTPIVFWVQDLWPESLSAAGAINSQTVINVVRGLVRFIYSRCDRILVQSRSFIDAIVRLGVDRSKIEYFPNSAEAVFDDAARNAEVAELIGYLNGFKVMFAGNIGASQDFESILGAAESLKEYKNIHWIIIGDGRMFPWVQEQVNKRGLSDTFHLLGRHPLALMPAFFAQANVMLVSLKKKPIFALTIPAKVQSYLACSRPIIAAIDGEGARVVEDAAAGLTCPPEEPGLLAKTVLQASKMPAEDLEEMARRGRYYFEKNFDSTTLVNRLEGWFAEVAGKKK